MKYYLIAGERSGDLHGANLMAEILVQDPEAQFRFYGGDHMLSKGGTLVKHYREMAFMGIWEVLKNLKTIKKNMEACKNDILSWKPDAVVLIDYAGFNMRIAKFLKANSIPSLYYIAPKVWAWNTNRAYNVKKFVDQLYVILPFEKKFFAGYGIDAHYVGNPLWDEIRKFSPNPAFLESLNIADKERIIGILPGSRKQEIDHMLSKMVGLAPAFPSYTFIIAAVSNLPKSFYEPYQSIANVRIVMDQAYDVLHVSKAALVTSGTATLETALFEVPQVMCYKTSLLTYIIGKSLVVISNYSLPNLVAEKTIIREMIQNELTVGNLTKELESLLTPTRREKMIADYGEMKSKMDLPDASKRTAQLIINYLRDQSDSK